MLFILRIKTFVRPGSANLAQVRLRKKNAPFTQAKIKILHYILNRNAVLGQTYFEINEWKFGKIMILRKAQ